MIALTQTGAMRQRISIEAPDDTITKGDAAEGYDTGNAVAWWASIQPMRSDEFTLADQVQGTTTMRLNMRYFAGLTKQHRIILGARTFNITSIRDLGEVHREHEVICLEAD